MAYREADMWEILEVLRRLHRRETSAAIERATGRTRKTIRRYKQRAHAPKARDDEHLPAGDPAAAHGGEARAPGLRLGERVRPILCTDRVVGDVGREEFHRRVRGHFGNREAADG